MISNPTKCLDIFRNTFIRIGHLVCRMNLILDFNLTWYALLLAFLISWGSLLIVRRKNRGKREAKEQIILAFCGLVALGLMEFFAVSTNLWHYSTGDWPIILWPTYFAAILFGYQLLRSIEGVVHKPNFESRI